MLAKLGPMRLFLLISTVLLVVMSFFAISILHSSNPVPIYVIASLVPIYFFVLLLDMMMNLIHMADKKGQMELVAQYRINIMIELIAVIVLTLAWLPSFKQLFL